MHGNLTLSLYDCGISSLEGIGTLAASNGERKEEEIERQRTGLSLLDIGQNPLTTLPNELSKLSPTLTWLLLDDCAIQGPLPDSLYRLVNLEVLRISQNGITSLRDGSDGDGVGVEQWKKLRILCLDGNKLTAVPKGLVHVTKLETLSLRYGIIARKNIFEAANRAFETVNRKLRFCNSWAIFGVQLGHIWGLGQNSLSKKIVHLTDAPERILEYTHFTAPNNPLYTIYCCKYPKSSLAATKAWFPFYCLKSAIYCLKKISSFFCRVFTRVFLSRTKNTQYHLLWITRFCHWVINDLSSSPFLPIFSNTQIDIDPIPRQTLHQP